MKNKYESDLLESLHETAAGLHKIGVISDHEMQEYDQDCFISNPKSSSEGKSIPSQNTIHVYASSKKSK